MGDLWKRGVRKRPLRALAISKPLGEPSWGPAHRWPCWPCDSWTRPAAPPDTLLRDKHPHVQPSLGPAVLFLPGEYVLVQARHQASGDRPGGGHDGPALWWEERSRAVSVRMQVTLKQLGQRERGSVGVQEPPESQPTNTPIPGCHGECAPPPPGPAHRLSPPP